MPAHVMVILPTAVSMKQKILLQDDIWSRHTTKVVRERKTVLNQGQTDCVTTPKCDRLPTAK